MTPRERAEQAANEAKRASLAALGERPTRKGANEAMRAAYLAVWTAAISAAVMEERAACVELCRRAELSAATDDRPHGHIRAAQAWALAKVILKRGSP